MPFVSPNILVTLTFLRAVECGLPLLLDREMRDVVLQHVVLRFQRRELRYKAGVAGRVEDDISDTEEREARRRGQQQETSSDEPFAPFCGNDFIKPP